MSILIATDGTVIISSETCVYDEFNKLDKGCGFVTDIKAGHLTIVNNGYIQNNDILKLDNTAFCLFEYIYFMKPSKQFNDTW